MSDLEANRRIAKNSVFMSVRMVFVLGITLYTTRLVLAILGVEDYGVYNVVCGFVSMFAFLNTSMSNGIQRFYNYELGKNGDIGAKRVFNMALLLQIVLSIVILFLAETFGQWYLHSKMVIPTSRINAAEWIFQFSIATFIFVIFQVPYTAAVMAHERLDFYSIISILDVVIKLIAILVLPYLSCDNLIMYGALVAFVHFLEFIIYLVYSHKNFSELSVEMCMHNNLFRSMLAFSGWNFLGTFSNMMKEQGINLVLNLFFGPVVNAARAIAIQVNGGLQSFVQNIVVPVRPQVVQSYASGNISRAMHLTYTVSKLSCLFLYVVALPILAEMDTILHIWLGANVPEHTSSFVLIIVLTSFVNNLNAAVSGAVHATGQVKKYQIVGSSCVLLSIPMAYLFLKFGMAPEWALVVVFFTMIITQILSLLILKSIIYFSLTEYLRVAIMPFVKVVLFTFWIPIVFLNLMETSYSRMVLVFAVSLISVIIAVFYLGLNCAERKLIMDIFIKKRKRNK